ncbi:hypothetical protein DM01DRAFT_1340609 [Hesseltinella vesiculosa]|uniref:Peroxin/Ferlin domain-containing protein n=1 Tax=Hesseltinella vesiculosa TaxID=101127 RepID=A0A1X2G3I4_9FUNG|nr:hypothetical protein DM01DRAFT_1340609 [Hesseltinella vesiculosa]
MKPSTYQLPDPTWEWVNKDWMVDMTDDVDEAGWQYAVRFHGAVWHGNYKHFRSFVRRRRWIRLRHRITQGAADPVELPTSSKTTSAPAVGQLVDVGEPSHACSTSSDWPTQFAQCRLDRERIHTLTSLPPPEKLALLSNGAELMKYLHQLDFEDAKRLVLKDFLLAKYQPSLDQPIPLSSLSTQEKIFIDSLCFYSDMCSLLLIDA